MLSGIEIFKFFVSDHFNAADIQFGQVFERTMFFCSLFAAYEY